MQTHNLVPAAVQGLAGGSAVGYLRLDARPTKQAIITWVSKWTYLYTSYLQSKVRKTD